MVRMTDPGEAEVIMTETEKRGKRKSEDSIENLEGESKDEESSDNLQKWKEASSWFIIYREEGNKGEEASDNMEEKSWS